MPDLLDRLTTALADRYAIERELGAGGMATVYLAHDVKHDRKVALKVLRPELAAVIGAERFLAEIKTTANLQHPHILPLHDSGELDGTVFYVMPFVEGESLRDRLNREKQLPVADAVRIATEVAGALDYAHRKGIIHRDIKPENILVHDGRALVADFGIALAAATTGGTRITETGMSLGTPHYMSPEQAMGEREIDARTDIYALGCVVYEMLTGEPPFDGPTAQAIVAKVMSSEPEPVTTVRPTTPPAVAAAVHTSLQKLPADRFPTAAAMAAGLTGTGHATLALPQTARPTFDSWIRDWRTVAMLGAAVAVAVAIGLTGGSRADAEPTPTRRALLPMGNFVDPRAAELTMSADGRVMAVNGGRAGILVRRMDELTIRAIPESGRGNRPFLSADGSRVGFIRSGELVVQSTDGGNLVTYPYPGLPRYGASFIDDRRFVIVDSSGLALFDPAVQASETLVPHASGLQYQEPHVLPGGRRIVFTASIAGLGETLALAVDVESGRVDTLARQALSVQYSDGWLYFARPSGALVAVRMEPDDVSTSGPEYPLGDVAMISRTLTAAFAVGNGVIVYGQRQPNRLVATSPTGGREVLTDEAGVYHSPRVSPDGRRVVFDRDAGGLGGRDVWMLDLATRGLARVTDLGDAHDPVWTPDGREISFISFSAEGGPLFTVSADGAAGQRGMSISGNLNPGMWLRDGERYAAGVSGQLQSDLVILHADNSPPDTLLATGFDEHSPAVSPDGASLAYTSNESGLRQVYVRNFGLGGGRTLVSVGSGEEPVWSNDGSELFYVEHLSDRYRLLAARIEPGNPPSVSSHRAVVEDFRYEPAGNHVNWDVMPDGRFLVAEPESGWVAAFIFNWAPPEERD